MCMAKEIKCNTCGSQSTYTLKDGTVCCRKCGHRSKKDGKN